MCSTATVAEWGNGPWTMMAPVSPDWRTGCGPCPWANRSAWPWPWKCRGARLLKGCSNGPCTCTLRLNTASSLVDRHRSKKAYTKGLVCHPSGPLTPVDTLAAGCAGAGARRHLRPLPWPSPPTLRAHTPTGCGHGGIRKSNTSRRVHTRSVSPAAIAGVRGRHGLAEPVPLVGRSCGNGIRRLACGKQKL